MQTVTLNADNRSIIAAQDADVVQVESNHVRRNEERIYGLGASTVTLYQNVNLPDDWMPGRYFFDGNTWETNPDWIDPEELLQLKP